MNSIDLIATPARPEISAASGPDRSAAPAESFGRLLSDAFEEVNRLQREKNEALTALSTDRSPDIHGTVMAIQKADLSLRLLLQARNKVVAAYEEIMRMNV